MTGNNEPRLVIQPRDEHLLRELAAMRIISREQAKLVAGFGSTTRANTRLLTLYRAGLLQRFFQGTRAGGTRALYALSAKGAKLIGSPYARLRFSNDELIVANFFVAHQLRVNSIYCTLRYRPIPLPGISFTRWVNIAKPVVTRLTPDGYFELAAPQGLTGSFVEIDLGYEGSTVWKEKVRSYLRYASSGDFTKQFGQHRFRVLVVTTSDSRVRLLAKVIEGATDKIFWVTSFEAIDRKSFWSPVWVRPSDPTPKTLL